MAITKLSPEAQNAMALISSYHADSIKINDHEHGDFVPFYGGYVDKSDLEATLKTTDTGIEIQQVFFGIGRLGNFPKSDYTIVMMGLDQHGKPVEDRSYDYGKRIPPGRVKGWEYCTCPVEILPVKPGPIVKRDDLLRRKSTSPLTIQEAEKVLCNYFRKNNSVLLENYTSGSPVSGFYGVIIPKDKLLNIVKDKEVYNVVVSIGLDITNGTVAGRAHNYNLIIMGTDKRFFINCKYIYIPETTEMATELQINIIRTCSP